MNFVRGLTQRFGQRAGLVKPQIQQDKPTLVTPSTIQWDHIGSIHRLIRQKKEIERQRNLKLRAAKKKRVEAAGGVFDEAKEEELEREEEEKRTKSKFSGLDEKMYLIGLE
jgi:hypothetical protein